MFTAGAFTIAKQWNQPESSNNRGMDKENMVSIHKGIVSAIKNNELLPCAEK